MNELINQLNGWNRITKKEKKKNQAEIYIDYGFFLEHIFLSTSYTFSNTFQKKDQGQSNFSKNDHWMNTGVMSC